MKNLVFENQLKKLSLLQFWMGIPLIMIGSIELILISTVYSSFGTLSLTGASIWGGLFVIISGCFARAASDTPNKCHLKGGLTVTAIAFIVNLGQLGLEIYSLIVDEYGDVRVYVCSEIDTYLCATYLYSGKLTWLIASHAVAIVFGAISFGCTLTQLVYLSLVVCCKKTFQGSKVSRDIEMQTSKYFQQNQSEYNPLHQTSATKAFGHDDYAYQQEQTTSKFQPNSNPNIQQRLMLLQQLQQLYEKSQQQQQQLADLQSTLQKTSTEPSGNSSYILEPRFLTKKTSTRQSVNSTLQQQEVMLQQQQNQQRELKQLQQQLQLQQSQIMSRSLGLTEPMQSSLPLDNVARS